MFDLKPATDFGEDADDGLYKNVPDDEYHDHPALSRSVLATAARYSPLHAAHKWRNDDDTDNDAVRLGSALHERVLRPDAYDEKYDVAPDECEASLSSGDPCTYGAKYRVDGTWLCGTHKDGDPDDIEVLKGETSEKIEGMVKSLRSHPDASPMLFGMDGTAELTALWTDDKTGLRCKARLDLVITGLPNKACSIVDLKSTRSAHPDDFRRSYSKYGYWLQDPFYRLALTNAAQETPRIEDFVFVAVEKEEPYAVQCYRISPEQRKLMNKRCGELISKMAEAQETGEYPSYADGVTTISMKSYERNRLGLS